MLEIYMREDGKWAWRLKSENGKIIATDGGQGYENKIDAIDMALSVTNKGITTWTVVNEGDKP